LINIFFLDHQSALSHIDPNQIDSLTIDINQYEDKCRYSDVNLLIFTHILTIFSKLKYLNFDLFFDSFQRLSFVNSPPATIFSSTLLELHVSLIDFTDCLYLLDGRFSQLHTLRVKTVHDHSTHTILNNKVNYNYFQ